MSNTIIIGGVSPFDLEAEGKGFEAVQVEPFAAPSMAGKLKLDVWVDSEQRERLAITPQEAREIAAALLHEAGRVEAWTRKAEYLGVEPSEEIAWRASTGN